MNIGFVMLVAKYDMYIVWAISVRSDEPLILQSSCSLSISLCLLVPPSKTYIIGVDIFGLHVYVFIGQDFKYWGGPKPSHGVQWDQCL